MIGSIVYITPIPLTERIVKNFYLHEAKRSGFHVEVWDVSSLLHKNVFRHEPHEFSVHSFKRQSDFENRLNEVDLAKTLFIPILHLDRLSWKVYRALSKKSARTAFFARGLIPGSKNQNRSLKKYLKKISRAPNQLLETGFRLALVGLRKLDLIHRYELTFCAGSLAENSYASVSKKTVSIPSFDYETHTANRTPSSQRHIVYLDDYLTANIDYPLLGFSYPDLELYRSQMDQYFRIIENSLGLPVVIAAHPTARYPSDFFGGRKIVYGQSSDLVRQAALVLTHFSTSISFAVIDRKPIALLDLPVFEGINGNYERRQIESLAESLNVIRMTSENQNLIPWKQIQVNEGAYFDYQNQFLASRDFSENTSSIFLNALKNL